MKERPPPPPPPSTLVALVVIFVICWLGVCWTASQILIVEKCKVPGINLPVTIERAGQFGDMFGVFNTLLTGIALCCAVYAGILQNHQIKQTKDQLDQQKKNDDEMFRREKLESAIHEMKNFRNAVALTALKMQQCKQEDFSKVYLEAVKDFWPAYADAQTLVTLYFNDYILYFLPQKEVAVLQKFVEEHSQKGEMLSSRQAVLFKIFQDIAAHATARITLTVQIADDIVHGRKVDDKTRDLVEKNSLTSPFG